MVPHPPGTACQGLGRGDDARPWRHHQRRRRRRGHQTPGGRAPGGCGGPCRPAEDPRGRAAASWWPCTAVWGPCAPRGACVGANPLCASGGLWGRQGGLGGAYTPLHPAAVGWGGSLSAVGGVQHLPGALRWLHNRLGDPSRSSRRSRIALGGPEDDVGEPSGGLGGPDPPPPRGLCPPGAALDEEHLLQESPQQRCSCRRGPFVGLGDAVGGPRGRPGRPSGGPAPPLPTP